MYSFYGGQKGQDFRISRIFSNRAVDMLGDLKMRWTSPVGVGEYVFINYGDPSYMNEDDSTYNENLQIDLNASGKSYTNSLWQKIYVDKNLEVSPDFPDSENNIYIFLNLDDTDSEEYGNSLKEVSDLESEENFGFGYRLIACVTGVTPRIQVFHQTINLEDGDPYVTLDLTNPDTPKIKFYLQRGQRINDVFTTTIGSQEKPSVEYITNSDFTYTDKEGETQKATLTNPYVNFHLPKAPTLYAGVFFGKGPISYYRNIGNLDEDVYTRIISEQYRVYKSEADTVDLISFTIQKILRQDYVEFSYSTEDEEIQIQDGRHFYLVLPGEYSGDTYTNGVFEQSDGKIYLNILNNTELKDLISNLKEKLTTNYSLNEKFANDDEEAETEWYFIRAEDNTQVALKDVIDEYYASSLYPISELIYSLFKYLMQIDSQDKYFIFDNIYIAKYALSILSKYDILKAHFEDIYDKGFIGDIYINEPTGKIYEICELSQNRIIASYLGTITAPAPYAETKTVSPFYLNSKGEYVRRDNQVYSNVSITVDNNSYQEIFTFELASNPITNIKISDTDNNKKHTILNQTIDSETEQSINIEAPMPIHIFTPSDDYGLYIDVNGLMAIRSGKNLLNIPMGLGDLFLNITSNPANAYQGNVYRCRMEMKDIKKGLQNNTITLKDIWGENEPIGNINGTPGIPVASQVINLYSNMPESEGLSFNSGAVAIYRGIVNNSEDNFLYYLNNNSTIIKDNSINVVLTNYLLPGIQIQMATSEADLPTFNVNFSNGQVLLINYFDANDNLISYWGIKINGQWSLISFTQESNTLFANSRIKDYSTKEYAMKGYSIQILEPKLIAIENSLKWHDWS